MAKGRNGRTNPMRGGKNAVSNVRIVDEYSGTDGARVDRMLSALATSQSQVRIEINSAITLTTITSGADTLGIFTLVSLRSQDEWASMSSQFQEFRVAAIRFDIYDVNPNIICFSVFSTFHEINEGSTANYSFQQVADGADAQVPTNGAPRVRLSWVAKGPAENSFQNVDPNLQTFADFGGLRYAFGLANTAGQKYEVLVKAVVDFRGRY
jgi:hypothetical protein